MAWYESQPASSVLYIPGLNGPQGSVPQIGTTNRFACSAWDASHPSVVRSRGSGPGQRGTCLPDGHFVGGLARRAHRLPLCLDPLGLLVFVWASHPGRRPSRTRGLPWAGLSRPVGAEGTEPDAPTGAGIASRLIIERLWPGVGEPGRSVPYTSRHSPARGSGWFVSPR